MILPDIPHRKAMLLADTIRRRSERLYIQHSTSTTSHRVTASLGVVTLSLNKTSHAESIVFLADKQPYPAKEGGRNHVLGVDHPVSRR